MRRCLIIILAPFIFAAFGLFLLYLGLFSRIDVKLVESPKISLVYLEHSGSYDDVYLLYEQVEQYLDSRGIAFGQRAGLFYQDPARVSEELLKSEIGVLVHGPVEVDEPFRFREVEPAPSAYAEFYGNPFVGAIRVYDKMRPWVEANGFIVNGPAVEIYKGTGARAKIDYFLPVEKVR